MANERRKKSKNSDDERNSRKRRAESEGRCESRSPRETRSLSATRAKQNKKNKKKDHNADSSDDINLPSTSTSDVRRVLWETNEQENNNAQTALQASNLNPVLTGLNSKAKFIDLQGKRKKKAKISVTETIPSANRNLSESEIAELDAIDVDVNASEDDFEYDDEDLDHESENRNVMPIETCTTPVSSEIDNEIVFNRRDKFTRWSRDPDFKDFVKEMVMECRQESNDQGSKSNGSPGNVRRETTPIPGSSRGNDKLVKEGKNTNQSRNAINQSNLIKSPSDTTIYAPAIVRNFVTRNVTEGPNGRIVASQQPNVNQVMMDKISKFVAGIRMDGNARNIDRPVVRSEVHVPDDQLRQQQHREPQPGTSNADAQERTDELQQARQLADQMVLNAEKFKASVAIPHPGNVQNTLFDLPNNEQMNVGTAGLNNLTGICDNNIAMYPGFQQGVVSDINTDKIMPNALNVPNPMMNVQNPTVGMPSGTVDDQFFHLTCHIDPNLKSKIERGEYVELEKLLPKDRRKSRDENQLTLVHRDGMTYFAPVSESKIGSVRRWEQAFRIYAAIYSRANPHRAAEIWQYVYVINTAATTYSWDNVSQYDITFRHLMSDYPARSWALIYHQMWNLAMRDPVNRMGNFSNSNNTHNQKGG